MSKPYVVSVGEIPRERHSNASTQFPHLSKHVNQLTTARIDRRKATAWAQNLKFLTFEPDDAQGINIRDQHIEADADCETREQCRRCSNREPTSTGHLCSEHMPNAGPWLRRDEMSPSYARPCCHVEERSCRYCKQFPLFPLSGPVRKFRIRKLQPTGDEIPVCDHFVAVSYTLYKSAKAKEDYINAPYTVVEEGELRNARASKDVIDRAVNFAIENGYRMIWIDQVYCSPSLSHSRLIYLC